MTSTSSLLRVGALGAALAIAAWPLPGSAQAIDHSKMHMPPASPPPPKPPAKPPVKAKTKATKKPVPATAPRTPRVPVAPAAHGAASHGTEVEDHAALGHDMEAMDHAAMGHDAEGTDHSAMAHDAGEADGVDHAAMGHDMQGMRPRALAPGEPLTPIPVLTDADRAAAVPPAQGHAVHDDSIHSFVLFDRLEAWNAERGTGVAWEGTAWIGTDLNRLWLRSEGERVDGRTEAADLEVLYGRAVAPWWDFVVGIRHDFAPGGSQDFAAIGLMGVAPYKFEVQATAYVGTSGQTAARLEAEYDVLLTNRLVLQPLVEAEFHGKDDPGRGVGSGLGTIEAGLRLRYEFTRRVAPYIGIVRERAFGNTADYRRAEGEDVDDTRVVAGVRIWF